MAEGELQAAHEVAMRGAGEILDGTGFIPIVIRTAGEPDYERLHSGAPLTQNEVKANLVAPRRLLVGSSLLGPAAFADWLRANKSKTVFLNGRSRRGEEHIHRRSVPSAG